jgi:glycosyltransferase involved in cell wall biosynthesis
MTAEPLNVVICVDHASITGGQAKVAIESAIGLRRAGARVIFFAAAAPIDPRLAEAGVEVECLGQTDMLGNPSRAAAMVQGTWNGYAARKLGELLQRLPRDNTVLHMHGWARALSPSVAWPIAASGVPAIYTVHEYFLFCPNGGFYNYQSNEICPLTPLSPACLATHCDQRNYVRKLWRSARLLVADHIARLPQAFADWICISEYQSGIIAPYLPKGARVHRVSNPIDVENPGPKPAPATGDYVFVGRLSPEKGAAIFAEAAERLGITPVFIGDGPLKEELSQRFPRANFAGWLSPPEAQQAMRAARALVFPSLWYEGQPLTVLEAKSCGTPVVVSDVCAGREEIEDGVSGLWFRSGDVGALAAALEKLSDDALVARLSQGAYDSYWRDPPTMARHVERLFAIYREMLERRRAAVA